MAPGHDTLLLVTSCSEHAAQTPRRSQHAVAPLDKASWVGQKAVQYTHSVLLVSRDRATKPSGWHSVCTRQGVCGRRSVAQRGRPAEGAAGAGRGVARAGPHPAGPGRAPLQSRVGRSRAAGQPPRGRQVPGTDAALALKGWEPGWLGWTRRSRWHCPHPARTHFLIHSAACLRVLVAQSECSELQPARYVCLFFWFTCRSCKHIAEVMGHICKPPHPPHSMFCCYHGVEPCGRVRWTLPELAEPATELVAGLRSRGAPACVSTLADPACCRPPSVMKAANHRVGGLP